MHFLHHISFLKLHSRGTAMTILQAAVDKLNVLWPNLWPPGNKTRDVGLGKQRALRWANGGARQLQVIARRDPIGPTPSPPACPLYISNQGPRFEFSLEWASVEDWVVSLSAHQSSNLRGLFLLGNSPPIRTAICILVLSRRNFLLDF